jgi:hypothetical protein
MKIITELYFKIRMTDVHLPENFYIEQKGS